MIYLKDILEATQGHLFAKARARRFTDLVFDSRRLDDLSQSRRYGDGPLFVAVKTGTGDGHDHAVEAVHRGATGILCQRVPDGLPPDITCVVVEDTRRALLDWAHYILRKHGTRVIAVTGSSGKTVTKEAIASVLNARFSVFRNYGSYSGRYGLPIALGRLEPSHRTAVLELAADSIDEIRDLARLTQPRIGVVTTINTAHVDNLGSIEAIEREKGHLVEALPSSGWAVLNRDDPRVWRMRDRTSAQVISYGFDPRADYVASKAQYTESGLSFHVSSLATTGLDAADFQSQQISLHLMGRHHIYAALAALAVAQIHGIPIHDIVAALGEFQPLPGRLHLIPGQHHVTLLDDSYDAQLACTLAALDAQKDHFPTRRRIAVLGGLRGGQDTRDAYQQIGEHAARTADVLVLKGEQTDTLRQAALAAGMVASQVFETFTNHEAIRYLARITGPDDVVLIKGAREARMEEITRALMMHPEHAPALLVRQEEAYRHVHLALPQRPTWIEVDLEAIAHNLRQVHRTIGEQTDVMVVLKADGYGHGAMRIARTVLNNGARMLGVACLSEAVALRRGGIEAPILVLGYTPAWQALEAVLEEITVTAFDLETLRALSRSAGEVGRTATVHIKVDTGMGRLGLLPEDVLPVLRKAIVLPNLVVEGIFTHFSVADASDQAYTRAQLDRFTAVLRQAQESGIEIPVVHAANSAAILTMPEARFGLVRLGIALYGLAPSPETPLPDGFRPALSFKTRIAQVKALPPGSFVSYGNAYQTEGYERIAVIPVGYADGFRRAPRHWGEVLVRGQRAAIVGRVCMDQTMINVSHIPDARQGDQVVLIGQQGGAVITVDEVAQRLGTINYEVVSEILARVPRIS